MVYFSTRRWYTFQLIYTKGQANLEKTHYDVGREVRGIVQKNVGKNPEALHQEKQLPILKKELREGYKKMKKGDKDDKK